MCGWDVTDEGDKWSVMVDVRDLGGHLDSTFRGGSAGLHLCPSMAGFGLSGPCSFLVLKMVLRLPFLQTPVCAKCVLQVFVLYGLADSLLPALGLSSVCLMVFLSGFDPAFCVIWSRFRTLRRYLAYRPDEVPRVYPLIDGATEGCPGHGPAYLLVESAAEVGFQWNSCVLGWERAGLPFFSNMAGPIQHVRAAVLDAWKNKVSSDLCASKGFRGGPLLHNPRTLQLLNSGRVRERDKALLRGVLVGEVWNGFLLVKVKGQHVPCRW